MFLGTSLLINVLMGLLTVGVFLWIERHTKSGLLYYVNLPTWVELVIAVLLLDLMAQYVVHYLLTSVQVDVEIPHDPPQRLEGGRDDRHPPSSG